MEFGKKVFDPADDNRRVAQRRRVLKGGQLLFNDGNSTVDCTLRDISDTGARVRVNAVFDCPREVELKFRDGLTHRCEVRWFRNLELGLHFIGGNYVSREAGAQITTHLASAYEGVMKLAPTEVMRLMRTLHFFGDDDLQTKAALWAKAHEAVAEALARHLRDDARVDDAPVE